MIFKRLLTWCMIMGVCIMGRTQEIPDQMEFCGMKVGFTPAAKRKLAEYVGKIYESPRYFNQMVKKADIYMPFIEEALRDAEIPEDLKYLSIQESGLRADAVSISGGVGFWQLKEDHALNFELKINDQIDERMHVYRASNAAAIYFLELYKDFGNWVYAMIAYHEGFNKALDYISPGYYGATYMMIDDDLHWYALNAIAHKIAYEDALNMKNIPQTWLEPVLIKGGSSIRRIYEKYGISEEEFVSYNKWLKSYRKLPKSGFFSVYLPRERDSYIGHVEDPVKLLPKQLMFVELDIDNSSNKLSTPELPVKDMPKEPLLTADTSTFINPVAKDIRNLNPEDYVIFELEYDLDYGIEYIQYDPALTLLQTASKFRVGFNDLITINRLGPNEKPKAGTILSLVRPEKAQYHIVQEGENLAQIALFHSKTVSFIQERNQMDLTDIEIYTGQKLYLKKRKPKTEKIIILRGMKFNQHDESIKQKEEYQPNAPLEKTSSQIEVATHTNETTTSSQGSASSLSKKWIEHKVAEGETLAQISQKYHVKAEIIKRINKLDSDHVQIGTVLRILAEN